MLCILYVLPVSVLYCSTKTFACKKYARYARYAQDMQITYTCIHTHTYTYVHICIGLMVICVCMIVLYRHIYTHTYTYIQYILIHTHMHYAKCICCAYCMYFLYLACILTGHLTWRLTTRLNKQYLYVSVCIGMYLMHIMYVCTHLADTYGYIHIYCTATSQ